MRVNSGLNQAKVIIRLALSVLLVNALTTAVAFGDDGSEIDPSNYIDEASIEALDEQSLRPALVSLAEVLDTDDESRLETTPQEDELLLPDADEVISEDPPENALEGEDPPLIKSPDTDMTAASMSSPTTREPVGIAQTGLYLPAPATITARVTLYPPQYGWSYDRTAFGYHGQEWLHIEQYGFDNGYSHVEIVSGYNGDDWLFGIEAANPGLPISAGNSVFTNNSTVHCIEYGITAPSPGGDNTRDITMYLMGESNYGGRAYFIYWGSSQFHYDPIYAYSADGQYMGFYIAIPREYGDPINTVVYKLDALTSEAFGQDDQNGEKLAGAQFTVRFWEGVYFLTVNEAETYSLPDRTWVVVTGANGYGALSPSSILPESDPLYYDALGDPMLPLGTVVIQETKAPDGYLLPSPNTPNIQQITYDSSLDLVTTYNPPVIMEQPRVVEVMKTDASSGGPLAGAEFALMRESSSGAGDWQQLYASKTTGPDGTVNWSPVPTGSYRLVETKAPDGFMLPSEAGYPDWHNFTIDEDSTEPVTRVSFQDHYKPTLEGSKTDAADGRPLAGVEFTLYTRPAQLRDGLVATDYSSITADTPGWTELGRADTDALGRFSFEGLPFGLYMLRETRPNPGYASWEESGGIPRVIAIDRATAPTLQVFTDEAIAVGVEVYLKTIYLTSSALDGRWAGAAANVGAEEFYYNFGARSTSNVYADELTVTLDLTGATALGYRMTGLWTGTSPAGADLDGLVAVLYRTNLSGGSSPAYGTSPLAGNPDNPNNPERLMVLSNSNGWRVWSEGLPTTESVRLNVSALGLADGEFITGIRAVYGGVAPGFVTGSGWGLYGEPNAIRSGDQANHHGYPAAAADWLVAMVATQALEPWLADGAETVIRATAEAAIARNAGALTDYDKDAVETRVISVFELGYIPLARTGESPLPVSAGSLLAAGCLLVLASVIRRRREAKLEASS